MLINLHWYAHTGNYWELIQAIGACYTVDVVNADGLTPLQCADYRKPEIIRALLGAGADFRVTDSWFQQPIHYAVHAEQIETVELLLNAGSNVNAVDMFQRQPLHYAIIKGSMRLVEVLVGRGADLTSSNFLGLVKDREMMDYLIEHNLPIIRNNDQGFQTMCEAIRLGNAAALRQIIQLGANVNVQLKTKGYHRVTPLALALEVDSIECVRVLLDCGADLNWRNYEGANYLHIAVGFGCSEKIVKEFLRRGLHMINQCSWIGHSPLSIAMYSESIESTGMVKLLLEYGASILGIVHYNSEWNLSHLKYCRDYDEILKYLTPSIYKSGEEGAYILEFINQNDNLKNSYLTYASEARKLDLLLFYDGISLLDVLVNDIDILTKYACNYELVDFFCNVPFDEYPFYGDWLRSKFGAAIERLFCMILSTACYMMIFLFLLLINCMVILNLKN